VLTSASFRGFLPSVNPGPRQGSLFSEDLLTLGLENLTPHFDLQDYIGSIRDQYNRDLTSKNKENKQIAVAVYLIDVLALRAGNEKVSCRYHGKKNSEHRWFSLYLALMESSAGMQAIRNGQEDVVSLGSVSFLHCYSSPSLLSGGHKQATAHPER
jgi:hypothetical protein